MEERRDSEVVLRLYSFLASTWRKESRPTSTNESGERSRLPPLSWAKPAAAVFPPMLSVQKQRPQMMRTRVCCQP
jgi:hypothetical protein